MIRKVWGFLIANSLLLMIGAVTALLWANTASHSYHSFTHFVHFYVNDILMAFFFLLAGKEIREAMLPGGPLSSVKTAGLPLLATLGGMAGPALIYLAGTQYFGEPGLVKGWAVPTATDIAFSYMVAKLIFGPKHPAISFLLLLAVADDAGGLGILAVFYPQGEFHPVYLLGAVAALGFALGLRKVKESSWLLYLLGPGVILWLCFYFAGLHPALALVPLVWCMPHSHSDMGVFAPEESGKADSLNRMSHTLKVPVEIILFFFALVNAGVEIKGGMGLPGTLVLCGLALGKPIGIFTFAMIGTLIGFKLPSGMNKRELLTAGITAGIGFTVALFVATAAYPAGEILDSLKMGALCSFGVAGMAILAAFLLRAGRFASK